MGYPWTNGTPSGPEIVQLIFTDYLLILKTFR